MRSIGKGVWTSQKRFTGVRYNGNSVCVRGTLRCKLLGRYDLVAATGEGSHNRGSRFTIQLSKLLIFFLQLERVQIKVHIPMSPY